MSDDDFPKGKGDPDSYGYPGENAEVEPSKDDITNAKYFIGLNKPKVENRPQDFNMPSQFEGSDNMPNDPEQADLEDIYHA